MGPLTAFYLLERGPFHFHVEFPSWIHLEFYLIFVYRDYFAIDVVLYNVVLRPVRYPCHELFSVRNNPEVGEVLYSHVYTNIELVKDT